VDEEETKGAAEVVDGRRLKAGWRKCGPDEDGDVWYEGPSGASSWSPPFETAQEGDCEYVDGRPLKPGWVRCEDETDVWYEFPATGASEWSPPFAR